MPFSHPARLVMVTHEFYPHRGGIAVYAVEMAAAAAGLGYAVEVWAPALPSGTPEPVWPFEVRRLPVNGSHSLRNQWQMARELQRHREQLHAAILYVPEPGPLLSILLLQFFHRLPPGRLVITLHGSEILKLALRPLMRRSMRRLLAQADKVSVVSGHALQLLNRYFPQATQKVVLTSGALRADFCSLPPAPRAARPADHKIIVLTVARLHPRKGQLRVLESLQALPLEQQARLEYWLVGGHPKEGYETALRDAATRAGFPVRFLGDVPDGQLSAIYAQADIFAMTSMPHRFSVEGFGLVYLEAGAHGLPVVAHAIGGVPEAVGHNETGLLVSPDDAPALTAAFAELINDPALRLRLGEAGRLRARRRTWRDNAVTLFGLPHAGASA
jgi:glycosyltransferase involved in cell wall biosynthesis